MLTIWKYPLKITDEQVLTTPAIWDALDVQFQEDQLVLWIAVDTGAPLEARTVRVLGTGNPIPDDTTDFDYVGTVQQYDGDLVWHVFIQ